MPTSQQSDDAIIAGTVSDVQAMTLWPDGWERRVRKSGSSPSERSRGQVTFSVMCMSGWIVQISL